VDKVAASESEMSFKPVAAKASEWALNGSVCTLEADKAHPSVAKT
jgi:hypothetical protein